MRLLTLLAADYANVSKEGKPNVMGVFTEIYAEQFPVRHSSMYLVMSLEASPAEYDQQRELRVKLITEDGRLEIVDWHATLNVPRGSGGRRVQINHILRLQDIVFPAAGDYQFSVLVDNDEKGSLPMQVTTPCQLS